MNKEIDLINKKFNLNYNNSNEISWEYIIKNYVLDSKFIKKYYKKFKINDLITYQDIPIKVLYELSNKIFKSTSTVKLLIQNQELTENYIKIYIFPYLINFKISGNIIKNNLVTELIVCQKLSNRLINDIFINDILKLNENTKNDHLELLFIHQKLNLSVTNQLYNENLTERNKYLISLYQKNTKNISKHLYNIYNFTLEQKQKFCKDNYKVYKDYIISYIDETIFNLFKDYEYISKKVKYRKKNIINLIGNRALSLLNNGGLFSKIYRIHYKNELAIYKVCFKMKNFKSLNSANNFKILRKINPPFLKSSTKTL